MGAGERRRALRRQQTDAAEAHELARVWSDLATEWAGPQRGRTADQAADAEWAREMARAVYRQGELVELGPVSLRRLSRLVRVRADIDRRIAASVDRLRDAGATWQQIAAELGISTEGARKRYGGAA